MHDLRDVGNSQRQPNWVRAARVTRNVALAIRPITNCSARFNPIWEFPYTVEGRPATMVFTSVSGHLMEVEFPEQ